MKNSIIKKIQKAFMAVCLIALLSCNIVMMFSLTTINKVTEETSNQISVLAADRSAESLLNQVLNDVRELAQAKSDSIDQELRRAVLSIGVIKEYIELTYRNPGEFRPKPIPNYRQVTPGELSIHWFLEKDRIPNMEFNERDLIRSGLMEETYLLGNMERTCRLIVKNMPDIFTIYVSTKSGQNIQYDADAALKAGFPVPTLHERPWYVKARDLNSLYISNANRDVIGRGLTVSMTEPYYDKAGEFAGVMGIDIKIDNLDKSIQKTAISESGYAMLLNNKAGEDGGQSQFVSAPGLNELNENDFSTYLGSDTNKILAAMRSMPSGTGYSTIELGGKTTGVYVIWAQVNLTNWQLAYVIPEIEILSHSLALRDKIFSMTEDTAGNVRNLIFKTLVLSIVLLLFIILVTLWAGRIIARRIAWPITALTGDVKKFATGNMEYTSGIQTGDEIEELALSFEHMARELRARTEELEKQTGIAVSASQAKSEFLAVMSHEIRSPLNAIIGLSEIELQRNLGPGSKTNLEHIYQSGSSLLGIVNDILDISKIEAGNFELILDEYETAPLINDAVNLNKIRIGSKPLVFILEVSGDFPRKLKGDELRVKRILNNILSNAIKYTRAGTVTLFAGWKKCGERALISFAVEDTGIGIRREDMDKLFSDYIQLDSKANRKIEGTGLGLAITRKLVEMMGGTIRVESEYGAGSSFTVELLQDIADSQAIGAETAESLRTFRYVHDGKNRDIVRSWMPYGKVLVVDDLPVNLQVARGLIGLYGLQIDTAASGREAIALLQETNSPYDLVFMDHMMPEMDGLEAVRIIREWEQKRDPNNGAVSPVPIIALTANALAGTKELFLSHGFNGYISKPIDNLELDLVLNKWVRDKQSGKTLTGAEMEKSLQDGKKEWNPGFLDSYPGVEGLDLPRGRERYGETAYLDVLKAYLIHTPTALKKARQPSRETLSEYTVLIHGLKGSSYGICASGVGAKAEELEAAARAGDFEKVLAGNTPFIEMVQHLLADLETLIKVIENSKAAKPKAPAPNSALLAKLLDAAKRYKDVAMKEALAELESYEYEQGGELLGWLREQMDNLEYDAIRERLEKSDPFKAM